MKYIDNIFETYIFLPRGFPHKLNNFCDLKNQEPRYADPSTIDASITCPRLLLFRSYSAKMIPKAHIKPPPPKSAAKLTGGVGFSLYRPNKDNIPALQNLYHTCHRFLK
jgi:hypothetical protein